MKGLFTLRGELTRAQEIVLAVLGTALLIAGWSAVSSVIGRPQLLPYPSAVLASFAELHFEDALVRNTFASIKLNVFGYLEAVAIALPLGFLIGLVPLFRGLFHRHVVALRYLPLTAVVGLFILWFGIYVTMKVQFLTLGILVYLLPVVVDRIDQVRQVYLDTVKTLGASAFQTIRFVYLPDVLSRVYGDIVTLVAISWTYIIMAEIINLGQGGIGALVYQSARQSRPDKVFAILVVIIAIGFVQDKALKGIGRLLFPYEYGRQG